MNTPTMSTDNTQHTPTPWKAYRAHPEPDVAAQILYIGHEQAKEGPFDCDELATIFCAREGSIGAANAAFIVKAVNSYDADKAAIRKLRKALENVIATLSKDGMAYEPCDAPMLDGCRAALEETKESAS